MYSFPDLEPVYCSMTNSNCCFLTCIQISQEAGQVVWYSHLLKNFPQFAVIHTVKGFGIVIKAEVDVFLELSCFFNDPTNVSNLISGSSAFSFLFFFFVNFYFYFILLYNTVLVSPYIDMNPPRVYMRSHTWTPLPPPSAFSKSSLNTVEASLRECWALLC